MNPWIPAVRPKTLAASFSPVLVGNVLAYHSAAFNWLIAAAGLACALCLQVTVNLANDYFDHKNEVDSEARLGPIRASQSGLISPGAMKAGIAVFTLLSIGFGLVLVRHSDIRVFLAGLAALICAFAYSCGRYSIANLALGELTVFIFFGLIAVAGSYYLQTSAVAIEPVIMGITFGLLNAAIMFTNNTRDIETDKRAHKNTLSVRITKEMCSPVYRAMVLGAFAIIFLSYFLGALRGLTVLFTGVWVFYAQILGKRFETAKGKEFNKILESTSLLTLLTAISFSIGYLIPD